MKIVHIVENLDDTYGGPAKSVPSLAVYQQKAGFDIELYSVQWHTMEKNQEIEKNQIRWVSFPLNGPRVISFSWGLFHALFKISADDTVIFHLHNLWNSVSLFASIIAYLRGIKIVISPRGSLYPWCLSHKRYRKLYAWYLFQKKTLNSASLVHSTDMDELQQLRNLGIKSPVALIPNCINMQGTQFTHIKSLEFKQDNIFEFLYMSRLHPKKGVDILLKAWSIYVDNHQGSTLKIAGTGKDDYIRHLRNLVTELNINDSVFFLGMLRNECREDAFKSSDIFVLPSHTENFGMAILEALTYGLPVITTTGTPWKDIKTMRAGWWIDLDLEKLVSALEDASSMSRSDYTKKSHNAKQIAEKYTCDVIADRMNAAYCWVLSAADNPDIYQSKDALG